MTTVTLSLAPLDSTDMAWARQNRNDYRIWQFCRQHDLISDRDQAAWFQRQNDDPTIRMYKILARTDEQTAPVGVCGLTSIDLVNRRAEFSLWIAPEAQGRGLGKMALGLLLSHGFSNLGLHLIWGETFETNPAAKMFESIGMRRDGTRRQFYWRDGRFVDAHLYSITREEWHERSNSGHDVPAVRLVVSGADGGEPDPGYKPLRSATKRRGLRRVPKGADPGPGTVPGDGGEGPEGAA